MCFAVRSRPPFVNVVGPRPFVISVDLANFAFDAHNGWQVRCQLGLHLNRDAAQLRHVDPTSPRQIHDLLDQLAETNPEWCMLVEVKYFLGLTDDEASEALGMKPRTMQRMWRDARQWLFARMESGDARERTG